MNDFGPHLLGARRSPRDDRDHPLSAHLPDMAAPDAARAAGIPEPPYNQDGGKCVAFSAAGDMTIEEAPEAGAQIRFDADEHYLECVPGDPAGNQGTTIRTSLGIRLRKGMRALNGPNTGRFLRIRAYSALDISTMDEIELAIYSASDSCPDKTGGSAWVAAGWPDNWWNVPASGILPKPVGRAGGHAFKLVEFDRTRRIVRILNSWGPNWGADGEAWVGYDDLLGILWEAWKTFDAPDLAKAR